MQQLVRWYYLATPGFFLIDWAWGVNVRVAFLDHFTAGRYAYYGVCGLLGLLAWRRPALAGTAGLVESGANICLLIVSFFVWYAGALEALGREFAAPPGVAPEAVTNFVLAAGMAGVSYVVQRARLQ
jgi:hypothetical protein